ncbi:uncharacterized protein LOC144143833 [Haemaphysalis longicornis]
MEAESDFDYSTLTMSGAAAPVMAEPLPCWCRGKPSVPLEDNPLVQWVKQQRLLDPGRNANDVPYSQASRGMGRGRPVRVDELLPSSSDEDASPVTAYWRQQRRLVEPSMKTLEPTQSERPANLSEAESVHIPPSSDPEGHMPIVSAPEKGQEMAAVSVEAPRSPQARRGIPHSWKMRIAQLVKPRRMEPQSGVTLPKHVNTSVSHGQPETSQLRPCQPQPQLRTGDAANGTAAPSGSRWVTRSQARAPVRGAQAPRRKVGTFDPSEFSHPLELDSWRNSWSRTRRDATSDSEHSEEDDDEDYEDDEDEPCHRTTLDLEAIEEFSLSSPSRSSSEVTCSEETRTPQVAACTQFLEIRGLPVAATKESIYDVVSSFALVDSVTIFRAEDGVGGRVILSEPYPVTWICTGLEQSFSFEGAPGARVSAISEADIPKPTDPSPSPSPLAQAQAHLHYTGEEKAS